MFGDKGYCSKGASRIIKRNGCVSKVILKNNKGLDDLYFPDFVKKHKILVKIRKVKTNLVIIDLKTHQTSLSFLLKQVVG